MSWSLSMFDHHVPISRRHYGYIDHLVDSWKTDRHMETSSIDDEIRRIKSRMFMLDPTAGMSSTALTLGNDRIFDSDGGKKELKIEFDVTKFAPEEIEICTKDNHLMVHAKHKEEKQEGNCYSSVYREFSKQYILPTNSSLADMHAELHKDGILTVEAPMRIPINHS